MIHRFEIPVGSFVHNVCLETGKGGQLARAAGNFGQLIQKDFRFGRIRLRSGEHIVIMSHRMCRDRRQFLQRPPYVYNML